MALETLSDGRDVVIVAAGSLLEAPASAEFAELVDVVVVVVPTRVQTRRRLQIIAQQLAHRSGPVLVVEDGRDHVGDRRSGGSRRFSMPHRSGTDADRGVVTSGSGSGGPGSGGRDERVPGMEESVAKLRAESRRGLG